MNLRSLLTSPRLHPARPAAGLLVLRLAFGGHLLQYAIPTLLTADGRADFAGFLASKGVPLAGLMALVSMGTELAGGLALVLGLLVRPAAVLLAGNFVVALLLVHLHQPYAKSFEALQMLAVAITLGFTGPGPLSVDAWLAARRSRESTPGASALATSGT